VRRIVRFLKWLSPDRWSGLSALSCVIPFCGTLAHTALPHLSELRWIDAVLGLAGLPLFVLMVGYPQVLMTVIVRSLDSSLARMIGALSSLLLAVWYAIWAAGADLTGNSTASLALIFYQIMVQGWAWVLAVTATLIVARFDSDEEP